MTRTFAWVMVFALLALGGAVPALCQDDDLGLGGLGNLGGLGALGALGGLGGLGNLGALAGQAGAAPAAPQTIVISQPAMLAAGNYLYIAYQGKVTMFRLADLKKVAEATFGPAAPQVAHATTVEGGSQGEITVEDAPAAPTPALVPGAKPAAGP